jgi:DHA2 family multidrug resistance protein
MEREIPLAGVPARQNVEEVGLNRILVVLAVMCAALMQTLDSTIVYVALPQLEGNLGATIDQATWVVTGFTIANVIVIPLTPWLARRLGRARYFAISIVGFTLASMACGLAPSLDTLILARIVQGAFGGGLLAVAQPILIETFPPSQLGTSQGIFTIAAICGPALGPALGGVLIDNLDWRWVFFINLPIGIIAVILVLLFLRDPEEPQRIKGDPIGVLLLAMGVGGMQYVLDEGERNYWFSDPMIAGCAAASVIGYVGFVLWELYGTRTPIVNLQIFRNRSVAFGLLIALTIGFPIFGSSLIIPQYVTQLLSYTATLSGMLILVRAVPVVFVTPIVAVLMQSGKVDPRVMLFLGLAVTGGSTIWQSGLTTSDNSFGSFVLPLILQGVGSGMLFVPLLFSVLGSLKDPRDSSSASAFINLFVTLGGSIASASLVTLLDRREDLHLDTLNALVNLHSLPIRNAIFDAHGLTQSVAAQISALIGQQAAAFAYGDVFLITGLLTLISVPLILGIPKPTTTDVVIEVG